MHQVPQQNNKKLQLFFVFIVLIGLYLRLNGIAYGLPYVLNPDEANCAITSKIINASQILSTIEENPSGLYLPLRFLSVFFGVGSIIVLYLIGGIFSTLVGALSSGFLAVSFLHVKFSKIFLPFSAVSFFSLLSVFFVLRAYSTKNLKYLYLAIIFASISTGMHYIGIVSIVPSLFVLAFYKTEKEYPRIKKILLFILVLFIFYVFLSLKFIVQRYILGYYNYHLSSYFLYLFDFLISGIGPVVWTASLFLFKYKNEYDLNLTKIIFSLPLICLGLLGFFHLTKVGYTMMLVPYICLAAALVFNHLQNEMQGDKKYLFLVLLLFAFYIPLKYTLKYNKLISLSDTRVLATEWVRANTTGGFKIAWDKNSIQPNWYDAYNKDYLKKLVDDPEVLRDSRRLLIGPNLLNKKYWFRILKKKVDYVIVNSLDIETLMRQEGNKLEKKYYKQILKLEPEVTFNPYFLEKEKELRSSLIEDLYSPFESLWQRERTGPVIKIYKL